MLNIFFGYLFWQIAFASFCLWGFKYIMKKKCNIEIDYLKYIKWLYKTIKSCFEAMFDTINKFKAK